MNFKMKLERKHKLAIIIGIAVLLIGYGLLDMVFDFNVSPKTVNDVSMILMVLAFALLFSDKKFKKNNTNQTEKDESEQASAAPIELGSNEQENKADNDTPTLAEPNEQDNQENQDNQDNNIEK